jgi:hypothetical protein
MNHPLFDKMGAFALSERDTHLNYANCQKHAGMNITRKMHIKKVLLNKDLSKHFLNRCELVLTKNFLAGAGAECENCKTVENEKRQCSHIRRVMEKSFKRDGTYVHADNFDTFPDLVEGPFISRVSKDMEQDKDSILELQSLIAAIQSSNEKLEVRLREREDAIKTAEARAEKGEAEK